MQLPWLLSCRMALALVGFLGFVNLYALRVNLSVALVCMVNYTALDVTTDGSNATSAVGVEGDTCAVHNQFNSTTSNTQKEGEFAWDKQTQGFVLGAFYWGYIVTQIPGGWLAAKFGGKRIFGWFMFSNAVATLLIPAASRLSYILLIILRFITGLGQGVVWPAMNSMWAYWAPPLERSKLAGITFAGSQIGNVVTMPISALLCAYGFDEGWGSVFYVFGGLGVLWFIAWMFIAYDSPEQHPRISAVEREYIQDCLSGQIDKKADTNVVIPWLEFAKSKPVWANITCHTCANFGTYIFLTNMPTYMKEVLKFEIKKNGLLSAIPYVSMWAVAVMSASLADRLMARGILNTTWVRKIGNTLGLVVPGILFVTMGFMDCTQWVLAVVLLTLGIGFMGFQYGTGLIINYVDIAPKYACVLFGISNTFATLPGFLAPYTVAMLTPNRSRSEWQNVFYIAFAIYVVGALVYLVLGSGEVQPWAMDTSTPGGEGKNQRKEESIRTNEVLSKPMVVDLSTKQKNGEETRLTRL